MDIIFLGHASFRLRGKTASLVTDPFDPEMVGLKFPKVTADIVTISHDHNDHNKYELVRDVGKVVDGPGEYEISGVSIIGISTFHDDKKGDLRGKNTIYVIEIDDLRVVHLGDLGHKLKEDTLESIGTIDILMIPVGGVYTIGSHEAVELTRAIDPSITIPMHYLSEGMNEESFGKLSKVDSFLSEVGLSIERTQKLSVKKADLVEDQKKVVVLERKGK
jgi:L-ascorbate metabolism protein UlaG (beta-lactamase superfamily)